MIYLITPGNFNNVAALVGPALERSCGYGQVHCISINEWLSLKKNSEKLISVFVSPIEEWASEIIDSMLQVGNKTLLLGELPNVLIAHFDAQVEPITELHTLASQCEPALLHSQSNSALNIRYRNIKGLSSPVSIRSCLRYDFADEWNNLGFGAISANGSIWALSQMLKLPQAHVLGSLMIDDQETGVYAGVWCKDSYVAGAALWFNRPVGPIDSQEWRIVEEFISHLGYPECACQPVLAEIPYGYDAAVTMRLDCDEDVESARALWQLYKEMQVPFSLALHAKVLADSRHHVLPRDVIRDGGAILSHTATHAPNWGGSYDSAYREGRISADVIADVTGYRVRYAVSPFHQTPSYARSGLADAGYNGCIGGIIKNDYDFLMARSGVPPFGDRGFIGHTQQCMLHGDCMLADTDPLDVYKKAFELAKASRTFFGYLDHPFSERYQYGWSSEDQRLHMHQKFIEYIKGQGKILFINEIEAMDYLHDRALVMIEKVDDKFSYKLPKESKSSYRQSVEYGGKVFVLNNKTVIS